MWSILNDFWALIYFIKISDLMYIPHLCAGGHSHIVSQKVFGNMNNDPDTALNRHNNFQTFSDALLLLFR